MAFPNEATEYMKTVGRLTRTELEAELHYYAQELTQPYEHSGNRRLGYLILAHLAACKEAGSPPARPGDPPR